MNRFIISIIVYFAAMQSYAQIADIQVSYSYRHPEQTMRRADADISNQYILLTDGGRSKFYSPKTEYIDSIESTPEGFENFNTFKRVCYEKSSPPSFRVSMGLFISSNRLEIVDYIETDY